MSEMGLTGGLPCGAVVKNPPANAGDTGSSLLSLSSRAHEPQLLKPTHLEPMLHYKRSHCNEKPSHHNEE